MREPTDDEVFVLRRAAWIINSTELREEETRTARTLNAIADDHDAPEACEGCGEEATTSDSEGVSLCADCMTDLIASDAEEPQPDP